MNPVFRIALHEMQTQLRAPGVRGIGIFLGLLLGFCLVASRAEYQKATHERAAARQAMRAFFLGQGAQNPHSAVHYGHYVFKPHSLLTVVDPGIEPFVGVTLQLEGHTQNDVQFAPAERRSSLVRFGQLSFTVLWQVVLPLLLIFLAHRVVVTERQAGTLKLLVAQGVSVRRVLWGKVLGYCGLMLAMLAASGLALVLLQVGQSAEHGPELLGRLACLLGCYACYYCVVITLTVYASARLAAPSQVLVLLLSGWFLLTILLPRLAVSVGEQVVTLPSKLAFETELAAAYKQGLNGHDPSDARAQRFQDSLLSHYGARALEALPVNADGLLMQADETYHNHAHDRQEAALRHLLVKQDEVASRVALLDPLLAVSHLSQALAQTDSYHHSRFLHHAEAYRRWLIRKLNLEMAYGGSKTGDWEWKVTPDYWRSIPDFAYQPPTVGASLRPYRTELLSLLAWGIATALGVHWAAGRLRPG
jgi:ABC-2 type transport system permease protein